MSHNDAAHAARQDNAPMEHFDLIIAGAGPAGAALACALTPWLKRIALIDAHPPVSDATSTQDRRVLALADSSVRILAGLGVWRELAACAFPIREVEIATGDGAPRTRLNGRERGLGALGYTLPAGDLLAVLHRRLSHPAITWVAPTTLTQASVDDDQVSVRAGDRELSARLLVAADGSQSRVRDELGIVSREHDYHQQAIVARLHSTPAPGDVAYELLTPGGPLVLLPLGDTWALVWAQPEAAAAELLALSDADFLARLQAQLGSILEVTALAEPRSTYPLRRVNAWTLAGERTALIGNAAHTVHPVGAQGFNLGLRDAATLAEAIVHAVRAGQDPGAAALLETYARRREPDHRRVLAFTDGLARLLAELTPARSTWFQLGLGLLQHLPPLRLALMHTGTGGLDTPTRLGRGLPL